MDQWITTLNHRSSLFKGMVKAFFICSFVIALSPYNANSQTEPFDSLGYEVDSLGMAERFDSLMLRIEEQALNCYSLGVRKVVPVLYQEGFSIYVQLSDLQLNTVFLSLDGSEDQPVAIPLSGDGAITIRNLPFDKNYILSGSNSCGEIVPFLTFYTDDQLHSHKEGITEVFSEEMFLLASSFAAQDTSNALALHEFMNSESNIEIHPFEKLNFYQQYIMQGDRYSTPVESDLIPTAFEKPQSRKDECECSFVKLSASASPTEGTTELNGQEYFKPISNGNGNNYSEATNVNKFHWYQVKGAAKEVFVYTSGWKADCDQEHSMSANHQGDARPDIDEAEDVELLREAGSYGRIAVSLLCNNGNQLPERCDCSKKILFDYEYRNALTARAERLRSSAFSCNRRRQSAAYAEDFVIVTKETRQAGDNAGSDNETVIMDFNRWAFGAECGTELNPEWQEAFNAVMEDLFGNVTLGDIENFISGDGEVGDIINSDTELPDLIASISNWITTERFLDMPCDTDTRFYGVDGKEDFTLLPNEELWFNIRTSGIVRAEGQRSWQSEARIQSSFAMTVQTFPGSTEEPNVSCCSDWGASYAGSTLMPGGSGEQINLQSTLEEFLNGTLMTFPGCTLFSTPDGDISNGEFGTCSVPTERPECSVPVIERSHDSNGLVSFGHNSITEVALLDIQGRVLRQFNNQGFNNFGEIEAFLRERISNSGYPTGIYLVRYHNGNSATTQKLFFGAGY